jgi:hypothetical protein
MVLKAHARGSRTVISSHRAVQIGRRLRAGEPVGSCTNDEALVLPSFHFRGRRADGVEPEKRGTSNGCHDSLVCIGQR